MQRSRKIVGAGLAAALAVAPLAAFAQVSVDVDIAPPALRYEAVPAPRPGFVWAPGYWHRTGGQWVWGTGRWIAARPGYHWAPDVWVHNGPRWHYAPGHWVS